mmetsp:Transcript_20795/g.35709  ORF Transcript_20795/g.35709 Transcript_20795/m.35709 type:complete len:254 (+) Transcript_20795:193-954(+)
MKLPLLFVILGASVGTASAFQPAPKKALTRKAKQVTIPDTRNDRAAVTKADMVAIRSPFWHAFDRPKTDEAKIDYVADRDYTVALTLIAVGIWLTMFPPSDSLFIDMLGGAFHLWFGSFIGYQTMRTRVVFNKDTFELKTVTNKVLGLQRDKGLKPKEYQNYVLGTNNEWRYDTFVNWDFFPCVQLPILVYFKETQTPKEMQIKGSIGPHQMDRRDNGQMHWFPAFANARQLRDQFEAHGCAKIGPVNGERPF